MTCIKELCGARCHNHPQIVETGVIMPDGSRPIPLPGWREAVLRACKLVWSLPSGSNAAVLGGLALGLVVVIVATTIGQIGLNAWNQPFYDALAKKDLAAFGHQILVFLGIAGSLLVLNVAQIWLQETVKVRLRERLTRGLVSEWLEPRRAVHLALAGEIGVNPDQRIHEDARHLSELSADLAIGLFQSALLLASFVGVLWILSQDVVFSFDAREFSIPGYMVWCALLYAATASWLSWRIGRPLIALNAQRYAREADLRFTLVRAAEHVDAIALHGGEAEERRRIDLELDDVIGVMLRLVRSTVNLTWVTAGSGWLAIIAPLLVAAPGYFGGGLTFGKLMMAVGAFQQVQQALRWFVENFGRLADWRATFGRVTSFRTALLALDDVGEGIDRLEAEEHPSGGFTFDHLEVMSAAGCSAFNETDIEIAPGSRVLIVGDRGSGKSTLFRAIAGLWPWGKGRMRLPPRQSMMFLPQRPYIPLGSLREALIYPAGSVPPPGDAALAAALERVRLSHLVPSLDVVQRWDRELTLDEQQRLAFARLLLNRPAWVIMDEAIDTIEEDNRRIVLSLFETELTGTGVLSIGRRASLNGFYSRVLHLTLHRTPCPWPIRQVPATDRAPKTAAASLNQRPSDIHHAL
ncbi:ABC transporter ATP-binding protein/permease [Chelatococcus asaccharovorans]|nr:ABC transporter ATP-binding protein/permease [Chelatococcus asaccharovorans]MBS7706076.1 ABC transporter ATP-binding protein/permease [Chelatococcus asaccharovorans]